MGPLTRSGAAKLRRMPLYGGRGHHVCFGDPGSGWGTGVNGSRGGPRGVRVVCVMASPCARIHTLPPLQNPEDSPTEGPCHGTPAPPRMPLGAAGDVGEGHIHMRTAVNSHARGRQVAMDDSSGAATKAQFLVAVPPTPRPSTHRRLSTVQHVSLHSQANRIKGKQAQGSTMRSALGRQPPPHHGKPGE